MHIQISPYYCLHMHNMDWWHAFIFVLAVQHYRFGDLTHPQYETYALI